MQMPLKSHYKKDRYEAGCDEAGRGCLAGPVVAAAVILDPSHPIEALNDSKQLSAKNRDALRKEIEQKALSYGVSFVDNGKIDEINILNASFLAMHKALEKLQPRPDHILVDGNRFQPYRDIAYQCIIKGDGKYMSIAAASILAKTYRDAYMEELDKEYPHFEWARNKGYPTQKHRLALKHHPISPYHRKSFQLRPQQIKLNF